MIGPEFEFAQRVAREERGAGAAAIGMRKLKPRSLTGSYPIGLRNADQLTPDRASGEKAAFGVKNAVPFQEVQRSPNAQPAQPQRIGILCQ